MDDISANGQDFGVDPLKARETDHYQKEYVQSFVEKWDELIDWMVKKQAMPPIDVENRVLIVNYLAKHYGVKRKRPRYMP